MARDLTLESPARPRQAAWVRARPFVGPLLLLAAAGYLYRAAGDIPAVPVPGQLGSSFWPRLVLIGLAASCVAKLVALWRTAAAGRAGPPASLPAAAEVAAGAPAAVDVPKLLLAVVLLGLYVAAAPVVGFALANALFLALFARLAGLRRPLPLLALAVGVTVALLYLFVKVVYLPLPRGQGVFMAFTLWLYRALGLF